MTLSALGIFSAAGAGGVAGTYELIESQILGSSQASITFSSLGTYSSTYKHLQIRAVARSTRASTNPEILGIRFNADSGSNYSYHQLYGTGSSVVSDAFTSQTSLYALRATGASVAANVFNAGVVDILDPYSTTKNTTTRSAQGGVETTNLVLLTSGAWYNTNSITSLELVPATGSSIVAGSRFSLYGIRG